jgi:hypothetical protein
MLKFDIYSCELSGDGAFAAEEGAVLTAVHPDQIPSEDDETSQMHRKELRRSLRLPAKLVGPLYLARPKKASDPPNALRRIRPARSCP